MTLPGRLRSSYIRSVAAQIAGAVASFGSFVVMARMLAPADLGSWVLYLTIAGILEMLRAGLIQTPFVIYYGRASHDRDRCSLESAAWALGIGFTAILASATAVFAWAQSGGVWDLLIWYPFLGVASLPVQIASWRLQARAQFGHILWLRLSAGLLFLGIVVTAAVAGDPRPPAWFVIGHATVQGLVSVASLVLGWAPLPSIARTLGAEIRRIIRFGRFSVGTLLGSNLLRSSDALILGWFLGPAAVAVYALPQKLLEAVEVPLRGIAQAAYPDLTRQYARGGIGQVRMRASRWVIGLTGSLILLLPFALWFAEPVVTLVGGESYRESAAVLRVFAIYALLLPLDRFIGVALDVADLPALNLIKVGVMVAANVTGDVLVMKSGGGLVAVAAVTVLTTVIGVLVGHGLLRQAHARSLRRALA